MVSNNPEQALLDSEQRELHQAGFYVVTVARWCYERDKAERLCNELNRTDRRRTAHFVVPVTEGGARK